MKVSHGIALKDVETKLALMNLFGHDRDIVDKINGAFSQCEKELPRQLTTMFGRKAAANFLALLDKDVPSDPVRPAARGGSALNVLMDSTVERPAAPAPAAGAEPRKPASAAPRRGQPRFTS
jgi:hypothetical protein